MKQTNVKKGARRGIYGQIVEEVGNRIIRGDWKPEEKLPDETEFAVELNVSRTVVREVLKVLSDKGLIVSRPRIGTRVAASENWNYLDPDILKWIFANGPTKKNADDLIELRQMVEPVATRLAALRRSEEELVLLKDAFQDMTDAGADVEAGIEPDIRFHNIILKASRNQMLKPLGHSIETALAASFRIANSAPGAPEASLARHEVVLNAIAARDGDAAEEAMRILIDKAQIAIFTMIEE